MNDLLKSFIKICDVTVFINDVIVGTEIEEGHDDIMEKILKKIAENDLFIKLEKCIWKVRRVGFLEVVIEPDGMKMEKEKVQKVVDWPVPREVKNVQKFLRLVNYYK